MAKIVSFILFATLYLLPCAARAGAIVGGYTANSLGANDDGSSAAVALGFSMNFYGTTYTTVYVNNNGNVTFGGANGTYTPTGLTGALAHPIIAPFYADVDTLPTGSGIVTYQAKPAATGFNGHATFGVEWPAVDFYSETNGGTIHNTFELLLVSRSDISAGAVDIYFNYGSMQWETGGASGGNSSGLGGSCATAGISSGTGVAGTSFQIPGSGLCGKLINGGAFQLNTASNDSKAGQQLFGFRNGSVVAYTPEPASLALLGTALAVLGLLRRGRNRGAALLIVPLLLMAPAPGARAELPPPAKSAPDELPRADVPAMPAFRPNGKAFEFYHAGDAANLSPDGLVAIVEGRNIRVEDVADTVAALPDAMRELPYDTLYPMVLEMLVNHTALAQEAIRQGLDNDKGVQRRMRMAGYLVLEKELLDRFVEGKITENDLHRRYDDRYSGRPGIEEARTRVITLRTYDEAVEAIAALDHGSDFAAMARDRSLDPSRSRGGDLGYIRRERLHPSQAEAVFALEKGGHSVKPVRDNRGWSVVQVDERRMRPVPPYDEARAGLRQELMRELINEEIARIRAHTRFKQYNLDGSPLETDDRNAAWHIVAVPK